MPRASKSKVDKAVLIAVITGALALITTLITAYFNYKTQTNAFLFPIYITQTAESRLATQQAGWILPSPTIEVPTNIAANPLPTDFFVNTDTPPAPTLVPTPAAPSLCCLAGWDVFSSDGQSFTASPQGNCPNIGIDELGIHASNCGLVFGRQAAKQRGVFGLSRLISHNVKIKVTITISSLIEGEFWLGFSNSTDPQNGSLIYAITPDPGGISVFVSGHSSSKAVYPWALMAPQMGWRRGQPRQYDFIIELNGNKVEANVDSVTFSTEVALSTDRLFIGYRSKPETLGTYLDAIVSGLTITQNP